MGRPIHLWIVGIVSLLWNSGGAYDYVMTQVSDAAYMAQLSPEHRDYVAAFPMWFEAAWAVGVWFSVFGSLLLLLRSRLAAGAFGLSLLGLLVASVYGYVLADPSAVDVSGAFGIYFSIAIAVVIILLWIYARAMTKRGVLR